MYRMYVNNGYIVSVAHNVANGNITDEQYRNIQEAIRCKPTAPQGFDYRLTEELVWELYKLPQGVDEE